MGRATALSAGDVIAERYAVDRLLGRGASGEVYDALDKKEGTRVALKVPSLEARSRSSVVERFVHGARAVAGVRHPNLVQVRDFGVDASGTPFVAMELPHGETLARVIRDRGSSDVAFAVEVARQISAAVRALHAERVIHRDIKPANVLVQNSSEPEFLLKVLDFDLATAFDRDGSLSPKLERFGTLPYLAPERLRGVSVASPEADIYAIGAVLFELLSGKPPFEGSDREAVELSARVDPVPDLAGRRADVPLELARLVRTALAKRPEQRPNAEMMERSLALVGRLLPAPVGSANGARSGAGLANERRQRAEPAAGRTKTFVGRAEELARLYELALPNEPARRVVIIDGPSGIGKSALLEELLRALPEGVLALSGACRPSAVVPFSAIDATIQTLGAHLGHAEAAPDERTFHGSSSLLRVFPALREVEFLRRHAEGETSPADPEEIQNAAYDALRRLLQALSSKVRIVLALDDLHWIDERSSELVAYVLREPDPPAITLIGTRRRPPEVPSTPLAKLLASVGPTTQLELGPLDDAESAELMQRLAPETCSSGDASMELRRSAAGHPLLLEVLARHQLRTQEPGKFDLSAALDSEIASLRDASRRLLHAIAVSTTPLPASILCAAVQVEPYTIDDVVAARLARITEIDGERVLEPYHAAVREKVLDSLASDEKRAVHRRIATQLDVREHALALLEQLASSGAERAAAELAEQLARDAERELSFDRAATLYAVGAIHVAGSQRAELCEAESGALHRAGRTRDAARALERAAGLVSGERATAVTRRAGELFLLSGDLEAGLLALGASLNDAGVTLASNLEEILVRTVEEYTALRERGVPSLDDISPARTTAPMHTLELCLTLAQGLSHVDLRALPFAFRALRLALDAGDPPALQRACAIFVWNTASHFPTELVAPALELCRALTERLGTRYARALLHVARAEQLHFSGDFLAAEFECERAEQRLLQCYGVARELAGVRGGAAFIEYSQKGDYRRRVPETLRWMADAERRGDKYHFNMLRSAHALVWIAQDDPARARCELALATADWPGGISVFEVSVALYLDVADRYEGHDEAHLMPAQGRRDILESPAAQTPFLKGYLSLHRGWGALRAMAHGTIEHDEPELARVSIDTLRGLGLPMWRHVASALEANLRFLHGDAESAADLLRESEHGFRQLHMSCWAACARKRRGEIGGRGVGDQLERDATEQLGALGIVRPDKWCAAYFSMFDVSFVQARTFDGD